MNGSEVPQYSLTLGDNRFKCEEHYYRGDLPCPWPDCRSGTAVPRVIGVIPPGTNQTEYDRRTWRAIDGSQRYIWYHPKLGATFYGESCARTEFERLLGVRAPDIRPIYHYTSVGALHGILNSSELWLTNHAYTNDWSEIIHGVDTLGRVVDSFLTTPQYSTSRDALESLRSILDELSDFSFYIASFSLKSDHLSQWRAYGDVAIGFSPSTLMFGHLPETMLDAVLYRPGAQRRRLKIVLHQYTEFLQLDADHRRVVIAEEMKSIRSRLMRHVALFKHPAFREEREVRLVYVEERALFERMGQEVAAPRFRASGGVAVPYVGTQDLALGAPPALPLHEIVIGPTASGAEVERSVSDLLRAHGYPHVPIRHSGVPYRAMGG